MYLAERDTYAESASGCFYWAVWLAWIVANVAGFFFGEQLRQIVVGIFTPQFMELPRAVSVEGHIANAGTLQIVPEIFGGLASGLVIAVAQAAVLFPFLKLAGALEWTAATVIGRTVAWIAIYVVSQEMLRLVLDKQIAGMCILLVLLTGVGAIAGIAVGYAQGVVLRRRVNHPTWWVLANIPAYVAAGALTMFTLYIETENTVRNATTLIIGVIGGAITGIALMEALRQPTQEAEWKRMFRNRKPSKEPPPPDTVLGSAMYERWPPPKDEF